MCLSKILDAVVFVRESYFAGFMSRVCLHFASETKPLNIQRDVQVNGHTFFAVLFRAEFSKWVCKGSIKWKFER